VSKPQRSSAKPLGQLVGKTIADAFARQGFASTGLVIHWAEIVGAEVAGPGFINLSVQDDWLRDVLGDVIARGDSYGSAEPGGSSNG